MDQLIIRPARVDDVDRLTEFSAAMAQETEHRVLDRITLRLGTLAVLERPDHGQFMVAEVQQDHSTLIIAQLLITYEWSDWRNAQFWWIQSVYVDPPWRRRGVYRRMHEEVIRQARVRKDVCGVRLYVERSNAAAQTVYKRVGLMPSAYEVYEDDFVLARPLHEQHPTGKED